MNELDLKIYTKATELAKLVKVNKETWQAIQALEKELKVLRKRKKQETLLDKWKSVNNHYVLISPVQTVVVQTP